MEKLAPICLFVYNRLWHTIQTVEALKNNILASDSELYIFSDGSKDINSCELVSAVRSYINTIDGFKNVHIILRETNFGLANNIISGVSEIVTLYKQVIVLEDDLICSPSFLNFINEALDLYKNDENVASIHGYVYPIDNLPNTFFLKGADCWGWATWDRAWSIFESNGTRILDEIKKKNLKRDIDYNNTVGYVKMLENQIKKKNDSWAIRWHLSCYLNGRLTLYPGKSFVKNIGLDDSGKHSKATKVYEPIMIENYSCLQKIPIQEDKASKLKFEKYFRKSNSFFIKMFMSSCNILKKKLIKNNIKEVLKMYILQMLPPIFVSTIKNKFFNNVWYGNFNTWDEAKSKTTGYDNEIILNKIRQSLFQVKLGISKYERDGVLFNYVQYSWPLLTGLMLAAAKLSGVVNVLDFGGSLGSTYFQNKKFLDLFDIVKWSIIEQVHFVQLGKKEFEDERLKFYLTVNECIKEQSPNILILASVLQYTEQPYELLDSLISESKVDFIILDRTPFTMGDDRITIQRVPSSIYNASYPCHIFNLNKLKTFFITKGFNLIEEFESNEHPIGDIYFKGALFQKN